MSSDDMILMREMSGVRPGANLHDLPQHAVDAERTETPPSGSTWISLAGIESLRK